MANRLGVVLSAVLLFGGCAAPGTPRPGCGVPVGEGTLAWWSQGHPDWAMLEIPVPTGQKASTPSDWTVTATYADGKKAAAGRFIDQQMHGTFTYWEREGRVIREEQWDHGRRVTSPPRAEATPAPAPMDDFTIEASCCMGGFRSSENWEMTVAADGWASVLKAGNRHRAAVPANTMALIRLAVADGDFWAMQNDYGTKVFDGSERSIHVTTATRDKRVHVYTEGVFRDQDQADLAAFRHLWRRLLEIVRSVPSQQPARVTI